MATTLHLVAKNFAWRLQAITPTCTISGKTFMPVDRTKVNEADCSGLERAFMLTWLGRGRDDEACDMYQLSATHRWAVDVLYWAGRGFETTHELVLQDQFDIVRALRDDTKYLGYDDSNTSTDLSIVYRVVDEIKLDTERDDLWVMRCEFETLVKEVA